MAVIGLCYCVTLWHMSIATGNAFLALGGALNEQEGVYILRNLVYVPEV